ncbi:ATP-binding cassette, subfamily B [Actinopolymorpha cephalotaxi]|uniref:ATP-binding cassette subfamily B protein n=1 Tax=Actinopolymorpha cephalotaxi TaxID=504797 RepID=A0A1I2Y2P6_9ACTN|nr:ABC transporter ATP-binding protein [Actinopolymorpha cephalotaxi]NYH87305.1 ATP-binding cassette subfamily B protein [Actinopolymorpha cephalotaxi]SFH19994.1 ATP-binding cassette, subfamily B [Actinopolymorpha cephalotaxi]
MATPTATSSVSVARQPVAVPKSLPAKEIPAQPAPVKGWLRWLAPYLGRHRRALVMALAAATAWTAALVSAPLLQRLVVDDAIVARTRPVLPWVLALVGVVALRACASGLWRETGGRLSIHVQNDIRDDLYAHLQHLDAAAHERMQSGQLVARVNSDLVLIQQAVGLLPPVLGTVLQVTLALCIMAMLSPLLALVLCGVLVVLVTVTRRLHMRVYAASWDAQQREADMTTVAEEAITGVRVVKGFGQERSELARFVESLTVLFRSRVRAVRERSPLLATLQASPLAGQVLVLLFGGWLALNGHLTVGTFFAFLAYLADLNGSARLLAMVLTLLPRARSGTERIAEVFAVEPEVRDEAARTTTDGATMDEATTDGATTDRSGGSAERGAFVTFDDVSFSYPDGPEALDGFSLDVLPGETVAIVGPTGSGKSSALQLVSRLRDASAGRVLLDGVDVRQLPLPDLRRRVSMVFDEAMLLSGSIRDNIAYGRADATDDEVVSMAKIAAIHDFVTNLPEGYDTEVGQEGLGLSGGQRQRIALARALVADADVLVLDDATSAVDVHVERRILDAMREVVDGRTVIVVAYRESTVALADRVVLVDAGRVVDQGTHEELLARSGLYQALMSELADTNDDNNDPKGGEGDGAPESAPVTTEAWQPSQTVANPLRARVGDPVSPELLAALAALRPAADEAGVDVEQESNRHERFKLTRMLRPQRWGILLGLALLLVDALAVLAGPLLVQKGLDQALGSRSLGMLLVTCAVFGLVALIDWSDVWATTFVTARTTERILYALRIRLFAHLQRLGMDYYDRTHAGRIMTRLTSDVNAVAELIQAGLTNALVAIVTFTGMTAVLLVLNPTLALVVLAVVPPATVATIWYRRVVGPAYEEARELNSALNTYLHETLAVLPVTQAFQREYANQAHFRGLADRQFAARRTSNRATAMYVAFIELLAGLTVATTLLVGWHLVEAGQLRVAELVPFLLYLALAFAPIQQMATVFDIYQRARTGVTRIAALLAEEVSVPTPAEPAEIGKLRGDIELRDVTLQYNGTRKPALRGADLRIDAGERVAFVGQTGAGKSTIAKVITRFYDATDGQVEIDGAPVTGFDPEKFRQSIGYVPQEPFLFSRTIRDNIAYGIPDVTDEMVEQAARAVGAHDFIARLDGGYLHEVQERGRSLSAGQRQLLCLARALVLDPRILVLDEATSHLDLQSERRVEQAMAKVAAGRTTIVIAHRPQTLRWVDRIVTVHDGQVVADQTAEQFQAARVAAAQ